MKIINKVNINRIKGILFPDRIVDNINKLITINNIIKELFLLSNLSSKGIEKIKNKENLWMYEPAINSSPNGPDILLLSTYSIPKISNPKIYWYIRSKDTNKQHIEAEKNKIFKFNLFSLIRYLITKYKSKNLK